MKARKQFTLQALDDATSGERPPRDEQEHLLVTHARSGNLEAREAIILSLQGWVEHVAEQCSRLYGWRSVLLETPDLIQVGNVILAERLDQALTTERPFAYLTTTVSLTLRRYCHYQGAAGTVPQRMRGKEPFHICSLDALLSHTDDCTLLALISTSGYKDEFTSVREDYPSHIALYQAVTSLPCRQQEIIIRLFGLHGTTPESLSTLSRTLYNSKTACGVVSRHREKALTALRSQLSPIYSHSSKKGERT